ncbi:MAG TPA: hypothetical protein VJL34_07095, partial [Anaerolineales bacterium]|nr:hypothetical protein [Anaerolineales bacterium]
RVLRAVFSPDGRQVVTASIDGLIHVWEVDTGRLIANLNDHTSGVTALAFNPDGTRLASGDSAGNIILWDAQRYVKFNDHKDRITGLEFFPDVAKLASASADGTVMVNEFFPAGGARDLFLAGHSAEITSLAVSADGALLLTASADNTARLWDASTGELLANLEGHSKGVNAAQFMPQTEIVATASQDGTVRLWDWKVAKVDLVLRSFENDTLDLAFSPSGDMLVGRGYDNTLRIWTEVPEMLATGIAKPASYTIDIGESELPFGFSFSPDGEFLFATGRDERAESGTVLIWDLPALLASGETSPWQVVRLPTGEVAFGLGVSSRDNLLAVSSIEIQSEGNAAIYFWDLENLRQQGTPAEIGKLEVEELVTLTPLFSPDGSLFIANLVDFAGESCHIGIWDVAQIRLTQKPEPILSQPLPSETCYGAAIHPDGSLLATSGANQEDNTGVIRLWDLGNARLAGQLAEVAAFQDASSFLFTEFNPTGSLLAAGSQDGELVLWDLSGVLENGSEKPEVNRLRGHQGYVYNLAFTPDGSWLASTSDDDTIRLWQIDPEDLLAEACRRAGRNLSRQEWETTLGRSILDYHLTCEAYPGDPQVLEAIVETGREYVRQDQEAEAMETFERALQMDASLALVPEAEVARVRGQEYAKKGQVEPALAAFEQANEYDPAMQLDPAVEVAGILIDTVAHDIELDLLTYQVEVGWALDYLKKAVELDSSIVSQVTDGLSLLWERYAWKGEYVLAYNVLEFEKALNYPNAEIDLPEKMGDQLIQLTRALTDRGHLDMALETLQRAYRYNPNNVVEVTSMARDLGEQYVTRNQVDEGLEVLRWSAELIPDQDLAPEEVAAGILLDNSEDFIRRGQYAEALQALRRAEELDPNLRENRLSDLSMTYYDLCWEASLESQAELALPACERAIELVPDYPDYRDGRGLARALTGDFPGAIEDFQFYVDSVLSVAPEKARERQAWIQALQNGQNPFDEETLESLR